MVTLRLALVLSLLCGVWAGLPPSIPSSFSSDMTITVIDQKGPRVTDSYHWAFDHKHSRQAFKGVMLEELSKDVQKWQYQDHEVTLMPFFERHVCYNFPGEFEIKNLHIPFTSSHQGQEMKNGVLCDIWHSGGLLFNNMTWWVQADTHIPVSRSLHNRKEKSETIWDFSNFDGTAPSKSVFVEPNDCMDLSTPEGAGKMADLIGTKKMAEEYFRRSGRGNVLINDQHEIEKLNKKSQPLGWTAAPSKYFEGKTLEEVAASLGSLGSSKAAFPLAHKDLPLKQSKRRSVPAEYDVRDAYKECNNVHTMREQGGCGSCWAFATVDAFEDRVCIATQGKDDQLFAPNWLVACDPIDKGCHGGFLDLSHWFLRDHGVPLESCVPYNKSQNEAPECPALCKDGSDIKLWHPDTVYTPGYDEESIMQEIFENGPVAASMWVYEDFPRFYKGVYQRTEGAAFLGGHAINLIGYGTDEATGLDYWLLRNTWGNVFSTPVIMIRRGVNMVNIEGMVAATTYKA